MNPGRHLNAPRAEDREDAQNPVPGIPGLHYTRTFLTPDQQADCIRRIDAASHEWRNDLARRTQHHGWRYDYRARTITPDMYLGSLPGWLQDLAERLMAEMLLPNGAPMFDRAPEQVIVNEYQGAQGIRPPRGPPGLRPHHLHRQPPGRLGDGSVNKTQPEPACAAGGRVLPDHDRGVQVPLVPRDTGEKHRAGRDAPGPAHIPHVPDRPEPGREKRPITQHSRLPAAPDGTGPPYTGGPCICNRENTQAPT